MARSSLARRERKRVRRVLPCLGKNFVLVPVVVPDPPFHVENHKRLRDALLAAGAVEVVYGRVPEDTLQAALTDEIRVGHLTEDARKLAAEIKDITVFCHICAKDIRAVLKRIEDVVPNTQPLQVEHLFVDYKCFKKDILYLGMPSFECRSPRHSSSAVASKDAPVAWKNLDEGILDHYKKSSHLTGLSEITFEDLTCAVYRLFINKDFLLCESSKGALKDCSPFLDVLLKLLRGLMRMMKSHWSQHGGETPVLSKLLLFEEKVDTVFARLTELDPDGSSKLFLSNIGLDWACILKFTVLSSLELQNSLQSVISGLIDREREGLLLSIDRKLLKDSIEILKASSLYKTIVEVPYMRSAACYYSGLSKRLLRILDIGEYMKKAEMFMDREASFVMEFMDPKVETEIISLIVKEMVGDHITRLVLAADSHLIQLIGAGNYDDINRMFGLVRKLPDGNALFRTALTGYIRRTLGVLVADKEKEPIQYVQLILDERQKFERIIKQSVGRDMRLVSMFCFILREISSESLHLPEYLSLFMDHLLMQKAADLQAVGHALDKAVILVGDFDDKSAFEIYYQRHLADRLLCGTYNEEMECEVLLKLRFLCSPHYLEKLRSMINDITISELLMRDFYNTNLSALDGPPICIRMLRSNLWPKQPTIACNIPDDIMQTWEMFRGYYLGQHSGRKVDWCPNLGNGILIARLGGNRDYELSLSMFHLCILMLFNSESSLTFGEIQDRTRIPRALLKKCLFSLSCVEGQNVLNKELSGPITNKDTFHVNDQFHSQLVNLEFGNEVTLKNARIVFDQDASSVADSVIIKLVKEKSTGLPFNGVVKRLAQLLKKNFRITTRFVQKRLNSLILWELITKENRDGKVYYKYYLY